MLFLWEGAYHRLLLVLFKISNELEDSFRTTKAYFLLPSISIMLPGIGFRIISKKNLPNRLAFLKSLYTL